jgi:spermidine synthase
MADMQGPVGSVRPMPLTYYHPDAPMAETLRAVPGVVGGRRLGVVGLGTGAIACDGRNGDRWTFYEIDASIARIAADPSKFRFLSACAPRAAIVLGDARLTLSRAPEHGLDYLLIDAFNSDSIPIHLMTQEALALYLSRVTPDGLVVLHITSRHLELESVVAALVRDTGVRAVIKRDKPPPAKTLDDRVGSVVVALSRSPEALAPLTVRRGWRPLRDRGVRPWSDDFSNVFGALVRRTADDLHAK